MIQSEDSFYMLDCSRCFFLYWWKSRIMVSWRLWPRFNFTTKLLTWPILNHWQIGKFSFQLDWTWRWMWHKFPMLWLSSTFWIYADSGIVTRSGPYFEANTNSYPYRAWTCTTYFGVTFYYWEMNVKSMIWSKLMNQLRPSNLSLIWVLFLSQFRFLHCWA